MESYVRDHVRSIHSIKELGRRRNVVRGVVGCRLTNQHMLLLERVAGRFKISKTGCAEMLLEEAILDAAEELKLDRSGAEELFEGYDPGLE